MLPKAQTKFNKEIKIENSIYQRFKNPKTFWVITWLGKCCWLDDRIQREIILTNIANEEYNFKGYERSIKVQIPEEKTFYFSLGTYLSYDGKFLSNPTCKGYNNTQLIKLKDVIVDPESGYNTSYMYAKLKSSEFPLYREENDLMYQGAPYYTSLLNDIEIIIPEHVILSYFYYLSTLLIYHMVYGTYHDGMHKDEIFFTEKKKPLIMYDSTYIRYSEAIEIAKFILMKKGYKNMSNISANLFAFLYNSKNTPVKTYLTSKIPFDEKVKLDLVGKMISENKFLAFSIEDCKLLSEEKIFLYDKFEVRDLSDHSSLNEKQDNPEPYTQHIEIHSSNPKLTNKPTNHNQSVRDLRLKDGRKRFYEIPHVRKQPKSEQKNWYVGQDKVVHYINEISENIRNHSNRNNTSRANFISDNTINYIKALFEAIEKMKSENIECEYIYIYPGPIENSSYPPIKFTEVGSIILVSIYCKNYNYCLVVNSDTEGRMALLKCKVPGMRLKRERDPLIEKILIHVINKYGDLRWVGFKRTQELELIGEGLTVLHLFNHNKWDTFENTVQGIFNKLKKKLKI